MIEREYIHFEQKNRRMLCGRGHYDVLNLTNHKPIVTCPFCLKELRKRKL